MADLTDDNLVNDNSVNGDLANGEIIGHTGKDGQRSFFEKLFGQVEKAKEQDEKAVFKIFYLNEDALTVKVKGLFSRLPLQKMAWQYPDPEYWKVIFPTLQGIEFKCKVTEAERREDERFYIVVDASAHTFREAELIENAEYTGIVLQRTEEELSVDLGCHFRWKYGSLCGFLPLDDLDTPETFQSCSPGDKITVEYRGKGDRGLQFASTQVVDLTKYIGETVWVQVVKGENTAPYFMVEGKYRADLPITKTHYPTRKRKVQKLRNIWENGDILQCEVIDFSQKRGLIIKWIDDEPEELDWGSEEMMNYVGQKVAVYVTWSENGELQFLIDNKYPATLYGRNRSNKKRGLIDGQIITARVRSVDKENKCFKIEWVQWWV